MRTTKKQENAILDEVKQDITLAVYDKQGDELCQRQFKTLEELDNFLPHVFAVWGY